MGLRDGCRVRPGCKGCGPPAQGYWHLADVQVVLVALAKLSMCIFSRYPKGDGEGGRVDLWEHTAASMGAMRLANLVEGGGARGVEDGWSLALASLAGAHRVREGQRAGGSVDTASKGTCPWGCLVVPPWAVIGAG